MAGLSSGSTLLNPYQDYGNGLRYNFLTNSFETADGNSSAVLATPQATAISNSLNTDTSSNANSNWFFTPLGGANTKSPFEISLNGLSGLAGLVGNIYSTNKQAGVMKDQIKSNENIARANFANTISDAAYNRTNYANMVNGWGNQEFTNQTAQNALNSFNSLTIAANNLGISGDTLAAQKQQVKSLMG